MILLEKTLDILTALVRQTWHDPLVGLLLMIALCTVLAWRARTPAEAHYGVVRKGACPACGSALFGTTLAYQRHPELALVHPESPYLCPACDRAKVAALQRQDHLERADE